MDLFLLVPNFLICLGRCSLPRSDSEKIQPLYIKTWNVCSFVKKLLEMQLLFSCLPEIYNAMRSGQPLVVAAVIAPSFVVVDISLIHVVEAADPDYLTHLPITRRFLQFCEGELSAEFDRDSGSGNLCGRRLVVGRGIRVSGVVEGKQPR
ncbi:hypothetical protein DM860_015657 [Cuscuta australis]|uniref:Uncharacterized protein n=1 Tax=Cuscuta australis TaxID=267555 RepID=A0A328DEX3_9ASTE|nr:hypothetical protein DM860_015657 [Cuscuta australis]